MRGILRSIAPVGLVFVTAVAAGAESALEEVRVLSSGEQGVEAEVRFPEPVVLPSEAHPGYHAVTLGALLAGGEPGEPALPRAGFLVAVPPDANVSVSSEASDELLFEGIRPLPMAKGEWAEDPDGESLFYRESVQENPSIYHGGLHPSEPASLGPESRMRHLRVAPVMLSPVRWDPGTGRLRAARTIRVHIRFQPGSKRDSGRQVRDEESWERTYRSSVINGPDAVRWTRAPERAHLLRTAPPAEGLVKIEVKRTELKRVSSSELEAIGWWPGYGLPVGDLYLFERFYDSDDAADPPESEVGVPIYVFDADQDGTWSAGDAFYFYAQNLFDRLPDAPEYVKRYGRRHVYWLGLRPGVSNPRMETSETWLGRNDLTPVASFRWRSHFEEEGGPSAYGVYSKPGAGAAGRRIDDETDLASGVAAVRSKHAYWMGGNPETWYTATFDLPGFLSAVEFAARYQGMWRPIANSVYHQISIYLNSESAPSDTVAFLGSPLVFDYQDSLLYVSRGADLAGLPFAERGNRFMHVEAPNRDRVALHWFEVEYERTPRFVNGKIDLATGDLQGSTEFRLASAPDADEILGFEITDPRSPRVLSIDGDAQYDGNALRLQWDLTGTDRRFFLARLESIGMVDQSMGERITLNIPSDLAGPGDQDYVVILPREWISTIQPLIDHREAQGHRVLVAAIEDVYDEFSGGRHWPHAIRSFLRRLFVTRDVPPSFLLLVGDATDGFDNDFAESDPNWVPTQTMFSDSYLSYHGPELQASDQWFVDNLEGTGEALDFLPDMHVGRIPAGNPIELQNMVTKLANYESFQPDDNWRNRVLFVSDDAWSSAITFTESYTYRPLIEGIFEDAARWSRDVIEEFGKLPDFGVDTFFVGQYMDAIPELGRCVINPQTGRCQRDEHGNLVMNSSAVYQLSLDYGTETVAPLLWGAMSRGHLFVSYNGHANARLMTHEYVFRHNPQVREDVRQVGNLGMPFVFMGYGCHLAEFSAPDERRYARGDGISESLLNLYPDRGGIAAIASTGYEWLSTTDKYNLAVVSAFFKNPPQYEGHTRWVLGEVLTKSKASLYALDPHSPTYLSMCATYVMLGDPGMVMDAAPPRLSVWLDGDPIENGAPLVLPADQDSIRFEARIRDEVWARGLRIQDAHGEVADTLIRIVPDSGGDRGFTASYTTTVLPRDYNVVLRAEDGTGREAAAIYLVRVSVDFQIKREGQEWSPLTNGGRVLDGDSVRAVVALPRYLNSGELDILLDGSKLASRARGSGLVDGRSRDWTLTALDPIPRGKSRVLAVKIVQPGGEVFTFPDPPITVETNPSFSIGALYNVPNPFAEETWFFYSLGAPAEEVTIRIYASSGRLVRTLRDLPSPQSLRDQPILWDGCDEDGDRVANGLYFYKLTIKGARETLTRIEKLAKVR